MRFALTSLDLETVTPHAGRCRSFLVFEAEADIEPVKVKDLHSPKTRSSTSSRATARTRWTRSRW